MPSSGYGPLPPGAAATGPGAYWEAQADEYYAEHGEFLGDAALRWCPEGWDEDDAHLLGDVAGLDVIEVGCGAGQGSRWAWRQGARAVGVDLSSGMLRVGARLDSGGAGAPASGATTGPGGPPVGPAGPRLVQGDARALPFGDQTFDLAFTAFGALPFVPRLEEVFAEV
ncbi:MAG: methyltransferase domain-containing protein, partial [Bifidobacteriaceae bacterium]|nr:methyltransferase domain-containing protein [Bifidobacteriaceae bacterium]